MAFEEKLKNINIQFYTLGYLDTNLAFGKDPFGLKGSTFKLANIVFKNLNVNFKRLITLIFWSVISFIFKNYPFFNFD